MEYDTAFHAAHIQYMRVRASHLVHGELENMTSVRTVIAEMLAYPDHLTEHGRLLLTDLDGLAATAFAHHDS